MEIERIDEWIGQDVVDPGGEKVGKLEDLYYAAGGDEPVLAAVKHGTLGKSVSLVPLTSASVTRSYMRITHSKDSLKGAPDVQPGTDLASTTVNETASHFGATLEAVELESATRRRQATQTSS